MWGLVPSKPRLCYFVYLLLTYVKKLSQISCSFELNGMTWHILWFLEIFFGGAEDKDENNCNQSSPDGRSKIGSPEQEVIFVFRFYQKTEREREEGGSFI
jgi:hypothetical protein